MPSDRDRDEIEVRYRYCKAPCEHDRASHAELRVEKYDENGVRRVETVMGACLCRGCKCTKYELHPRLAKRED